MFDDLQGIMARRGEGDEKGRVAQVIVDQINWYRDMRTRLRADVRFDERLRGGCHRGL